MNADIMTKKDREVQSPLDIRYVKQIKWHLKVISLWPVHPKPDVEGSKTRPNNVIFVYIVIWIVRCISGFVYLKNNFDTLGLYKVGQMFINNLADFVILGCFVSSCFKVYGDVLRDFLHHIHLLHVRNNSEYASKVYTKVEKICAMGTNIVVFQVYVGFNLFSLAPLLDNYNSGLFSKDRPLNCSFLLSYEHIFPFDKCNMYRYIFLSFANHLSTYVGYIAFFLYIFMICLIHFHVVGHLCILMYNLNNLPKPAREFYTEEEELKITQLLVENFNHHKMIVNFISKTSKAFGRLIGICYSYHLFCGCIMLFELSEWNPVVFGKYFPATTITLQQLMFISFTFEYVNTEIEGLSDAIYNVPWQYMGVKNRKIVLFILMQMQRPVTLKALGMVPVGVRTMAAVLKTCFTYFLMLRTFADIK